MDDLIKDKNYNIYINLIVEFILLVFQILNLI